MALLHFLLLTSCAALEMGQEQFLRKVEVATPRWEASPTLRVQLYVCAVMCGIALVASLIFFYTSTPTSEVKEMKEGLETAEISEPAPEPEAVAEEPKNLGPALEEYEDLVRKLLQRGAQSMAPKVAKGVQVASILSDKVSSLTTKAKALVMTELTDTVGSVAQSLQLEEFMVLLDEDAALSANMPPISVLLAGLLVPVNLNFNIVCQHSLSFASSRAGADSRLVRCGVLRVCRSRSSLCLHPWLEALGSLRGRHRRLSGLGATASGGPVHVRQGGDSTQER